MKKHTINFFCLSFLLAAFTLVSCKKDPTNRGQVSEGITAGLTYEKHSGDSVNATDVIPFKGILVSQDGLKSVTVQLAEVLTINSFGNPVSIGNRFPIGQVDFKNKMDNSLLDGLINVKYTGEKNFETGFKNRYSEYIVSGSIDLSKFKLVKGKRYRLSVDFISDFNMSTRESPFIFVVKK